MASNNPQQPRDVHTGRFRTAGPGKVTVRQPDGSARTYRIDQDRRTGDLVQRLQGRFADSEHDGGQDDGGGDDGGDGAGA